MIEEVTLGTRKKRFIHSKNQKKTKLKKAQKNQNLFGKLFSRIFSRNVSKCSLKMFFVVVVVDSHSAENSNLDL